MSFWAWTQFKRHQVGFVTEKPPSPRKLSTWWSEVHLALGGNPTPLEPAFHRFAVDPHWENADPPLPFNAFVSQWRNYARAA